MNKTARPLAALPLGTKVFIQNQHGAQQGAWDRTGTVTEQLPHASYSMRVNGQEEYCNAQQDNTCVSSSLTTTA